MKRFDVPSPLPSPAEAGEMLTAAMKGWGVMIGFGKTAEAVSNY